MPTAARCGRHLHRRHRSHPRPRRRCRLVNVIKRANGIATNGQNIIIQLEGTICRYNPNLSKVDLSRKIGPNFYNKQQQQRRH